MSLGRRYRPGTVPGDMSDPVISQGWYQWLLTWIKSINDVKISQTASFAAGQEFFYPCDATAAAITVTLPAANSQNGKKYIFKKTDATANPIVITAAGTDKIDGATTTTLGAQYDALFIVSDGISKWWSLPFVITPVHVRDFGAVGDGVTDDSTAFQAAIDSQVFGGKVLVTGGHYLLDNSITIKNGVTLEGDYLTWKAQIETYSTTLPTGNSRISINSSKTINMLSASCIRQVLITRKGLTMPESTAGAFAGTALTSKAGTGATAYYGVVVDTVQILGFNIAADFKWSIRAHFSKVGGDNVSGIIVDTSWDVLTINDIHFWPFVTQYSTVVAADLIRAGVGITLKSTGAMSAPCLTNCFCFGYATGLYITGPTGVGTGSYVNCDMDHTGTVAGAVGFLIDTGIGHSAFVNCTAYSNGTGFSIDASPTDTIPFTNCKAINNTVDGFKVAEGIMSFLNCTAISNTSTRGFQVVGSNAVAYIKHCMFDGAATNQILASSSGKVFESENFFGSTATGASGGWTIPTLTAANPLVLPFTGELINVTGNTNFATMTNGGRPGRRVTLYFTGTPTITSGAGADALLLTGSVNLVCTAGTVLDFIYNGTYWVEVSRSVK